MRPRRSTTLLLCLLPLVGWAVPGCPESGGDRSAGGSFWEGLETGPDGTVRPAAPEETPAEKPAWSLASLFTSGASGDAKEGNYTVLLSACTSPTGHVQQAKRYKQATERHAGWKNLFIVHKTDHSLLYWGRYKRLDDARPNLKKAKAYRTPTKLRVYAKAIIVPMPGKEDPGPAEWRLDNAPRKWVYTVLRATFYDVPEADYIGRRKFALDYCRQLRKEGIEAYYKHDVAQSIVTIGLFDASAVEFVRKGKRIQRIVRNGRVKAIFRRFPNLAVNGREKLITTIDVKTGKKRKTPAPTYLTEVPRSDAFQTASAGPRQAATSAAPGIIACELRIVRVADGSVLCATGGRTTTDNIENLARVLVHKLGKDPKAKGKSIAVASFRDRTKTPQGLVMADEFAFKAMAALLESGWFIVRERVDLSKVAPGKALDDPAVVKSPNVRQKVAHLDYVVLGSVALSEPSGS